MPALLACSADAARIEDGARRMLGIRHGALDLRSAERSCHIRGSDLGEACRAQL
jgi:hypothetical protein